MSILDRLNKYYKMYEARDHKKLNKFLKDNIGSMWAYDVRSTPWCAAFVKAVLNAEGLDSKGGTLAARSFLQVGKATDHPKRGDIVVLKRGRSTWQGHVGFYYKEYDKGHITVYGGNQYNTKTGNSDQVNLRVYSKTKILGYRKV
jgi:uncharacterized protein (TIGR02594 family)